MNPLPSASVREWLLPLAQRHRLIQQGQLEWNTWLGSLKEHIEDTNPRVRALVAWRWPEEAISEGDLFVTYKDLIHVMGFTTHCGNFHGFNYQPAMPFPLEPTLRHRGLLTLGKAATTEFGLGIQTDCLNPRYPAFSPSGSSTGSAAAVAAGMCDASLGTDTSGSVRYPAGNCGVVGLRFSYQRKMLKGVYPVAPSMDALGLITRTVADLAYIWQKALLSRLWPQRRTTPPRSYRIGVVADVERVRCDPAVTTAYQALLNQLSNDNIPLESVNLPWWDERLLGWRLLLREAFDVHKNHIRQRVFEYQPGTLATILLGENISSYEYRNLRKLQQQVIEMAEGVFAERNIDFLLLPLDPVLPRQVNTPPPVSTALIDDTSDPGFAIVAALARLPALALPIGIASAGCPIGGQILARNADETGLIAVGGIIEAIVHNKLLFETFKPLPLLPY